MKISGSRLAGMVDRGGMGRGGHLPAVNVLDSGMTESKLIRPDPTPLSDLRL